MDPITNADPDNPRNVLIIFRAIEIYFRGIYHLLNEVVRVTPRCYSVQKLKKAYCESLDVTSSYLDGKKFVFKGRALEDDEFGLEDGAIIFVQRVKAGNLHAIGPYVHIKIRPVLFKLREGEWTAYAPSRTTVGDFFDAYEYHLGYYLHRARLVHSGRELMRKKTLDECGLKGSVEVLIHHPWPWTLAGFIA